MCRLHPVPTELFSAFHPIYSTLAQQGAAAAIYRLHCVLVLVLLVGISLFLLFSLKPASGAMAKIIPGNPGVVPSRPTEHLARSAKPYLSFRFRCLEIGDMSPSAAGATRSQIPLLCRFSTKTGQRLCTTRGRSCIVCQHAYMHLHFIAANPGHQTCAASVCAGPGSAFQSWGAMGVRSPQGEVPHRRTAPVQLVAI